MAIGGRNAATDGRLGRGLMAVLTGHLFDANRRGDIEMRKLAIAVAMLIGVATGQGLAASTEGGFPIAGTQPWERPAGAPVIREVQKPAGWFTRALTGISQPYPPSLRFLEDQGNWYTPFNRPGMLSPYDIRGWHVQ
jgi:hypothetical protein